MWQGKTLAFIHGLNTYIDWNVTNGKRRGDNNKKSNNSSNYNKYKNPQLRKNARNAKQINKRKLRMNSNTIIIDRILNKLENNDYYNIYGLNKYISYDEYVELLARKKEIDMINNINSSK